MMSADLPALMSDGLENLLIDEIELCPTEQNNPEVTLDLLEQGLAPDQAQPGSNQAQPGSSLEQVENPQMQAASDAGSVENTQSEAESSDDGSGVVVGAFFGETKPSDSSETTPNGKKDSPNKRKWQSSEGSLDSLSEKKVSKTWTDCHVTINNSWINPARLLKEVQRILKKRLEEAQWSEKDNAEKLETAICKVKEEEEVIAGLKEKNERLVEELGEKEKELEEEEKTHLKIQQDLSKQVRTSVKEKKRKRKKKGDKQ